MPSVNYLGKEADRFACLLRQCTHLHPFRSLGIKACILKGIPSLYGTIKDDLLVQEQENITPIGGFG